MISGTSLVTTSRPSVIGASSDITRNGKPPSVTPTDEVPDAFSLGVPHPLAVDTHRPRTRLVRMVVGPTRCAAVKAYVPARWGVGSRRLFCEVLLLPLPQLVRGRCATCRSACMLLSRARTRVSRPGLLHVRPRWVCKLSPRRCRCLPARAEGGGRLPRSPLRILPSLPRGSKARSSPGWAREWLPCRPPERACPGWFY